MSNGFVYVVPYFNCEDDIEKTMFSMLAQSYGEWRCIIIDDMSTDSSPMRVDDLLEGLPLRLRAKFDHVRNREKKGEVRNTLDTLARLDDDDVVCRLDGGDWLVENDLLKVLDGAYNDRRTAVAWTAHRWGYTSNNISAPLDLIRWGSVYTHPWVTSHLKTFRAKHLRAVPEANFRDADGNYIVIACDQAVFLPMMHRAFTLEKGKYAPCFVQTTAYHYNIDLTRPDLFSNDRSIRQKQSAEWIRSRGYVK